MHLLVFALLSSALLSSFLLFVTISFSSLSFFYFCMFFFRLNPLSWIDNKDAWRTFDGNSDHIPTHAESQHMQIHQKEGLVDMIIDVQNVSWTRGVLTLLNNVSWRVNEGEHWALLGLNGSGKTTLLNMITGYQWPTKAPFPY